MEQEIIGALNVSFVLKGHYLFVELVQEKSAVFDNCAIVGGFEREEGIELLNQDANENISDV